MLAGIILIGVTRLWGEREEDKHLTAKEDVTISIHGKSKCILPSLVVPYHEGDTPLNLLISATKQRHIQLEYKGSGVTSYVIGIDNLYARDYGNQSGWMFRVNGVDPNAGCGTYRIQPGDKVEWFYTCDFGKDVGETLP